MPNPICVALYGLYPHPTLAVIPPFGSAKVTMGLDLQPDGLTAGLAGHCQLDTKYPKTPKEIEIIRTFASRETISHPQL